MRQPCQLTSFRVAVSVICVWLSSGVHCFADLTCPKGSTYVQQANFEYCVTTDAQGKSWYNGPYVCYFVHMVGRFPISHTFLNDKKQEVGTYIMGKKEGMWTFYYENGTQRLEMPYQHGRANGMSRMWNEQGMLISETEYKDNEPVYPEVEAAKKIPPSPEEEQQTEALNKYLAEHPMPQDPCDLAQQRFTKWIEENSGRANYEQAATEERAESSTLDQCLSSPAYKKYEQDSAEAAGPAMNFLEQLLEIKSEPSSSKPITNTQPQPSDTTP